MHESFGARLRQRREQQQIALSTVAEQTKIGLTVLEALERDDVSRWPSGIFRRAFIRAYAHAIGLEADVVLREFLEVHPDPVEEVTMPAIAAALEAALSPAAPPTRLRSMVGSAFGYVSGRRADTIYDFRGSADDLANPPSPSFKVPVHRAPAVPPPPAWRPDLVAAANLCTELCQIGDIWNATPLMERAAHILDAVGLVLWVWDQQAAQLSPVLAHGYSERVLAQLPKIGPDADNATAATFRSGQTCVVHGSELASGALVVPLMAPSGCLGVLAIELQHRGEQKESVRALAMIFAAQLSASIGARTAGAVARMMA